MACEYSWPQCYSKDRWKVRRNKRPSPFFIKIVLSYHHFSPTTPQLSSRFRVLYGAARILARFSGPAQFAWLVSIHDKRVETFESSQETKNEFQTNSYFDGVCNRGHAAFLGCMRVQLQRQSGFGRRGYSIWQHEPVGERCLYRRLGNDRRKNSYKPSHKCLRRIMRQPSWSMPRKLFS